ncbi:Cytochrome P450 [Penicillium fimorum]|uniref:Cytochrome P450 n=1 Tax=Penicillium fimorum TaxID=1882269 RepID=A0A9X0C627_9EURO|nr:Cytochrome P450 [Penicillium fimorum]
MLSLWIGVIFLYGYTVARGLLSPLSTIPGPWYTRFTSLWIKYQEFTANRRESVHRLHKIYGPVVRLSPNEVSFTSLDAIKEIYASGGSGYDKTEYYDLFRQFKIKTMFSTLLKDEHSKRKRIFADRYAMTNIMKEKPMAVIHERAMAFISKCVEAGQKSVDVYSLLHCYALDCVTHFMFSPGGLRSLNIAEDFDIMHELTYHQSLQKNLLEYYLPSLAPYFPKSLHARSAPKANQYVLEMASQTNLDGHSLMEKLKRKESSLELMQAAAECKDHMAAGIDTTGDGLCFLMWELSQPQNLCFQQRLYKELTASPANAPLDSYIYLDAVIKEALRCAPPIPMSLPRYVPAGGREIDGYVVPEHTIVSCQPYSVHRINESVFPEPDRFNPERWLAEEGATERNRLFFSFATGGRGCTGKNLALVEMKMLLREVYSRYRTMVASDMTASMKLDDQIISSRPEGQSWPAEETTDTIVMSVKDWYVDLRIETETGKIDWAIAGQRIVESQEPLRVTFSHELDSHNAFETIDCGTFVPLPNGDDLEMGSMPRHDLPGAPDKEYEEVWRELPFREGPEGPDKGLSWVLESDDGDLGSGEGEVTVTKTFIGRIWGTYLALSQEQTHTRQKTPSGDLVVKKSGADVSARREEWSSGWNEKYLVGEAAGSLPSMMVGFDEEGKGSWKIPGEKVEVQGKKYIVRAFEKI